MNPAYKLVAASFFNKLADTLSNAKTVLTWLMSSIGAPAFLVGLLVPIREAGSLLPQMIVSAKARDLARRKQILAFFVFLQAVCLVMIAFLSTQLRGLEAAWILLLVMVASTSRSVSSLTSKDVLAKVIDQGQRGSLMGWSATLAGLIGIVFGASLLLEWVEPEQSFVPLLCVAALCFLLSSIMYLSVDEPKGDVDPKKSLKESALHIKELLLSDDKFRSFIIVRSLMISSSLALPYLVLTAHSASGSGWISILSNLGSLIVISGFASLVSAKLWGSFADRDSRRVLKVTSTATCVVCTAAAILTITAPETKNAWSVLLFLLLSLIHQGVRLGRKTYVVDIAKGNQRSDYIAVGNTLIGLILIVIGIIASGVAQWSMVAVFLLFAGLSGAAIWRADRLASIKLTGAD